MVGNMRILMLTAYEGIEGPLPKLAPLMIDGMRELGCEVVTAPWSRRREDESVLEKLCGRSRDLWTIVRRLSEDPFDVLLVTTTHDWPALLRDMPLIALTARMRLVRVMHLHGSMVDRITGGDARLMKACTSWLVRRCDAVLVLSEEEREKWSRLYPATRVEVVVNPFRPPPEARDLVARESGEPPVLLFVGRLIREKGVFDLLDAAAMLPAEPCFRVRIAGGGVCEPAIRERIEELGLQERVELVGYVRGRALSDLYRSADAFVLPTYFGEGFPTVIAEAMSYGLPVVTTPIRGAADLLKEDENVLFVPPRRPRKLADVLASLLSDPDLRAAMGQRNRMKVMEFAPERVVPRYVEIMESLCKSHGETQ